MKKLVLLFTLALITLVSCKTSKDGNASNAKKKSAKVLTKKMLENQLDFEWFNCKTKIKYRDMRQAQSATASIRMRKDSVIWVQVTAILGIEAARIYMTPDSVYVLNRLNKTYISAGIDYIEKEFRIPVDFSMAQELIVGNTMLFDPEIARAHVKNNQHVLSCSGDDMRRAYWLEKSSYLLKSMVIEDKKTEQKIIADYDKYKEIDNQHNFAYFRTVQIQSKKTGQVDLELNFSKVELNVEKKFIFDVPARYKHVQY